MCSKNIRRKKNRDEIGMSNLQRQKRERSKEECRKSENYL
jgi:hypothetical protein